MFFVDDLIKIGKFSKKDQLEIYDGRNIASPLINNQLCGSNTPTTIFSHGNELFIRFHSNQDNDNSELKLKLEVIERGKNIFDDANY